MQFFLHCAKSRDISKVYLSSWRLNKSFSNCQFYTVSLKFIGVEGKLISSRIELDSGRLNAQMFTLPLSPASASLVGVRLI